MKYALCFLVFGTFLSFGQNEWSLQQCIDSALVHNTDIRLSEIDVSIAETQKKNGLYVYFPTLNGGASHGYNWGQTIDPFTNQFATDRVQYNNFYLNSSVTLFSGLKNYYSNKVLRYSFAHQELNQKLREREKVMEVVTAFLQAQLNKEMISVSRKSSEQTKREVERIENLLLEEFNTNVDLIKIKAQLAKDNHSLNQLLSDYQSSMLLLQQLIGQDYDSTFSIHHSTIQEGGAFEHNGTPLEVQLSELAMMKKETELKMNKGQYSPTISLNGSLGTGYSENNKVLSPNGGFIPKPFDDQINDNFYQSVSATINIPIFNNNRNKAAVKISRLEAKRVGIENEQFLRNFENRLLQLKLDVKNNQSLVESSDIMYQATKLDFENSELLFQHGNIHVIEFLRSKNDMVKAESELIQSKYKLEFSRFLLEILSSYR